MKKINGLPSNSKILAVDDKPENLEVIFRLLKHHGFTVFVAENGETALSIARSNMPELILLDIMMPEMDGFELCEKLKQDPVVAEIPVIFMTALGEVEDKVRGFNLGAVDYITKPLQSQEVLARIQTHLTLRWQTLELQRQKREMQKLNERLEYLNQEKSEFLSIAAHDLKNPLSSIRLVLESMLMQAGEQRLSDSHDDLRMMHDTIDRMFDLVNQLLDVNRIESGRVQLQQCQVNMAMLLNILQESYAQRARKKDLQIHIESNDPSDYCCAAGDEHLCVQILDNLISNAVKYSPPGKAITLRLSRQPDSIRVEVQDQGPGLSAEDQAKLFGKFSRLSARPTGGENSTGLGLFIVKKLVELMGGTVWCESEPSQGANFIFTLPAYPTDAAEPAVE